MQFLSDSHQQLVKEDFHRCRYILNWEQIEEVEQRIFVFFEAIDLYTRFLCSQGRISLVISHTAKAKISPSLISRHVAYAHAFLVVLELQVLLKRVGLGGVEEAEH